MEEIAEASAEQARTLATTLTQVVATLAHAVERLSAPKVPVRDKTGRILRVETVE